MMPVTDQSHSASLLLAGPDGGEVRKVLGVRVAYDPPVLERERVKVDRAPVNDVHNGELGLSAKRAGTAALQLLFREINHNEPVQRLWIDIEPPSLQVTGRSAELLFGLATYLHLGAGSLPESIPNSDYIATGLLDAEGNVGSVEAVAVKIRAALATGPKDGTRLFYPRTDENQIDDALRAECRSHGLILSPVDRIDEALDTLGVPILGSWPSGTSPFRALEAFDSSFSRVFFGRQREVEALTSLLEARAAAGRPGALIIGASGAGKSSFCLAGMVPALIKQKPGLQYAVWRPRDAVSGLGDEPADKQKLAASILSQWQVRDDKQLGMALARPLKSEPALEDLPECLAATGQCTIFVIDQFEELFTLNFTPHARIGFARFLQVLQARGIWLVGTLRSEFYANYLELCDEDGQVVLTPLFEGDGQYNLSRMSRDAFSQVITRPAELAGLRFEQRGDGVSLSQTLLADAMATDDALPLLGFALQTLYDEMERPAAADHPDAAFPRTLAFAAYEELGGLAGAIGTVAAEAYSAVDAQAQADLPGLLNALAVPSAEGNRETARPAPIEQWPLGTPGRRLIDALTGIRVLVSEQSATSDDSAQLRVAHEALFSHWELAAKLLSDSRQSRLLIKDFRQRAKVWDVEDQPRDRLLTTSRDIENARAVRPLMAAVERNEPVNAFIDRSIALVRRRKLLSYSSAAAALFVLLGFAGWARYEAKAADHQAVLAKQERARAVAQLAESAIDRGDAMTGILLARSQLQPGDEENWTGAAQSALLRGMLANREMSTLLGNDGEDDILNATFSSDGKTVLTHQRSSRIMSWPKSRLGSDEIEIYPKLSDNDQNIYRREISPDSKLVMTAYFQGFVVIKPLDGGLVRRVPISGLSSSDTIRFSPDGRHLVSISDHGEEIKFWTLDGSHAQPITRTWRDGIVSSIVFSPDSLQLLVASQFGTVRLWTLNGNSPTSTVLAERTAQVNDFAFSPDSRRAIAAFGDGTARIWTIDRHPSKAVLLRGHTAAINSVQFSPDGRRVVTGSNDGTAKIWTLSGEQATASPLTGHQDLVTSVEFSPDGKRVVTSSSDRTARVWEFDGTSTLLAGHLGGVTNATFSPDGQRVLTTSYDQSVRVWTVNGTGNSDFRLDTSLLDPSAFAIGGDGRQVMIAAQDGSARIWTSEGNRRKSMFLPSMTIGGEPIRRAEFTPDGRHLVTVYDAGTVRVWTLGLRQPSSIALTNHIGDGGDVKMSANGARIAVLENGNKRVRLWTWSGGKYVSSVLVDGSDCITNLAISSNGNKIALLSDTQIRVWSLRPNHAEPIKLERNGDPKFDTLGFGPNGDHMFAMGGGDGFARIARVWNLDNGGSSVTPIGEDGIFTNQAALSRDGRHFVTISSDYAARTWTLDDVWKPAAVLIGHKNYIQDVEFSPDSRRVLTSSPADGTSRIWILDGARPTSVVLPKQKDDATSLSFSSDGRYVEATSLSGVTRRQYVPFGGELLAWSSRTITRCLDFAQSNMIGLELPERRSGLPILSLSCGAN